MIHQRIRPFWKTAVRLIAQDYCYYISVSWDRLAEKLAMTVPLVPNEQMNLEELRNYCLNKPGVEETFPFDEETAVYKVMGKMFLLTGFEYNPVQFNVKCDPEIAIELRERYSCVEPGFHMSKKHWNTVTCDGSVSRKLLCEWIDNSYDLVVNSLPKKEKEALKRL